MKKQFNRMRQLANQTVGRAEKTEVLSEDLLQVEKRLELVKQVSHGSQKKLTACLQGQQAADADRRSGRAPAKKLPLSSLAQCFLEGAAVLGDDSLLGKLLKLCGETEDRLAQELVMFELQVEQDVVDPLCSLSEVEIPNIQKQRKHLAKLVLDMDSARTRWQQSSRSSTLAKEVVSGAKADSLREEMEEAANRMEICRDQLSADMYSFMARESDYANYFQTLIEVQAEYHRKSLELLQNALPHIKAHQESWVERPCYGKPLQEHLALSGREIAFPIEACVNMLLDCGLQEEGLFRVAPSASKLKKLKASLDCGVLDVQEYSSDPHAIAGALKSYLRELPEPLLTFDLYEDWILASNISDQDTRLQALLTACEKLPEANATNFRYLIKFLAKLNEYQDHNKMTAGNIAIVLGPNLLWAQTEGSITEMMTTVSLQIVAVIEPIIQHADWFFPGELDFNVTGSYGSPAHTNHNSYYSSTSPDMDQSERRPRPLSVATDNMMLEFYKKDGMGVKVMDTSWVSRRGSSSSRKSSSTPGVPSDSPDPDDFGDFAASPSQTPPPNSGDRTSSDEASSYWSDSCRVCPSPEEERPPPPYPFSNPSSSSSPPRPTLRPWARPEPTVPSFTRWSVYTPPPFLPSSSSLDINSNPKPATLLLPRQGSLPLPLAPPPVYIKPPLVLPRAAPPPWAVCANNRETGLRVSSRSMEASPVIGQRGVSPTGPPTGHTPMSDQSPHSLRRGCKKLSPAPARGLFSPSDPSPISLSPTPPSTPSSYGFSYSSLSSPGHAPSPPPLASATLPKPRTATKPPRQRPGLPPPQPPPDDSVSTDEVCDVDGDEAESTAL